MRKLLIDLITSLDGCASADGWPGWWGLEGPEYLAFLAAEPPATLLMGATTYRVMSGLADGADEAREEERASLDGLAAIPKVVFSATLEAPLAWPSTTLVRDDAVRAVRRMKTAGEGRLATLGSLSLGRSLLAAGLVDRFRVVVFPVITGRTGTERVYDGYPDVALEMVDHRTFDAGIQLLEYRPQVLDRPPR